MSTAQAFAPGSPAASPSKVLNLPPGMALPPLGFQSSSSADGRSANQFDNSGFVVNFGAGGVSTGGLPGWVLAAAAVGGVLWLMRKR